MDEHATTVTHWYCERCQRSGDVTHAPDAGVFEVFVDVIDAHHKAFVCIDADTIRTWQDEPQQEHATDDR